MKEIDREEVRISYILRGKIKDPKEFEEKRKELLNKKPKFWNLPVICFYKNAYKEFFTDKVKWYEEDVDPKKLKLVNNIFNSLCMTFGRLGTSFEEMIQEYKNKTLPQKDLEKIDAIRKTLSPNPRIIIITNDMKRFSIFDGWHTAIAFAAEGKKIPAFIGLADDFKVLRIK